MARHGLRPLVQVRPGRRRYGAAVEAPRPGLQAKGAPQNLVCGRAPPGAGRRSTPQEWSASCGCASRPTAPRRPGARPPRCGSGWRGRGCRCTGAPERAGSPPADRPDRGRGRPSRCPSGPASAAAPSGCSLNRTGGSRGGVAASRCMCTPATSCSATRQVSWCRTRSAPGSECSSKITWLSLRALMSPRMGRRLSATVITCPSQRRGAGAPAPSSRVARSAIPRRAPARAGQAHRGIVWLGSGRMPQIGPHGRAPFSVVNAISTAYGPRQCKQSQRRLIPHRLRMSRRAPRRSSLAVVLAGWPLLYVSWRGATRCASLNSCLALAAAPASTGRMALSSTRVPRLSPRRSCSRNSGRSWGKTSPTTCSWCRLRPFTAFASPTAPGSITPAMRRPCVPRWRACRPPTSTATNALSPPVRPSLGSASSSWRTSPSTAGPTWRASCRRCSSCAATAPCTGSPAVSCATRACARCSVFTRFWSVATRSPPRRSTRSFSFWSAASASTSPSAARGLWSRGWVRLIGVGRRQRHLQRAGAAAAVRRATHHRRAAGQRRHRARRRRGQQRRRRLDLPAPGPRGQAAKLARQTPAAAEVLHGPVRLVLRDQAPLSRRSAHHSILLGPRYRELLHDIFSRHHLAEDFSLYLQSAHRDRSQAGPGGLRWLLRAVAGAAPGLRVRLESCSRTLSGGHRRVSRGHLPARSAGQHRQLAHADAATVSG